jgi:hypothetical protein
VVASRRVVLPGLSELHGLGLIDWQRYPKKHRSPPPCATNTVVATVPPQMVRWIAPLGHHSL